MLASRDLTQQRTSVLHSCAVNFDVVNGDLASFRFSLRHAFGPGGEPNEIRTACRQALSDWTMEIGGFWSKLDSFTVAHRSKRKEMLAYHGEHIACEFRPPKQ